MKDILKYGIWTGICAVLIIPFVVANDMFFPYITGKAFTFRIIVEIILGLWLVLIIKDKEFRPKWSWVLGAAGLFTFILLLADINAVAPFKAFWSNYERMEGWVTFIHLFAYLLVLGSMLNTEKLWLWFLRANVAAGVILAITSIDKATDVRFSGPLGNPIYIAVYFLFIFFFTLILLYKDVLIKNLTDWSVFKKVFANILFYIYLIISGVSLFVVYRTSRGALLGAIGGIFVGMILISIFEKQKKVIRQIALGGIVAVIAVVVIFLGTRNTQFVQNNPTLKRLAEVSWSNINGQARQLIWPMALKGFQEKPILGWGQEGFNYVFNKYYDPAMYGQETWFDRAHNAPLDFLVAGGILGFLSYLGLFGAALWLLWFKKNSLDITEKALITGLLAGYLFQAIFVFDNLVSYIMFFTTLAYIHSRFVEDKETKPAFRFLSGFVSNEEYQNYILIPVVCVLTAASIYFVNIPGISANRELIKALRLVPGGQVTAGLQSFKTALDYKSMGDSETREQLLSITPSVLQAKEVDQKTKIEFLNFTVSEVQKQIDMVPNDARYYILLASLFNSIGYPDKALLNVQKAIELSPEKQAMRFELVQSLYMLGRKEEAIAEAKKAYELDTRYEQAKTLYETVLKEVNKK
jgi:tetratricopeptide (TPR) repeat protein